MRNARHLRIGDQVCDLGHVQSACVRSAFVRQEASTSFVRSGHGGAARCHAADVDDALASWLDTTPARVVNRLPAMASNGSK